MSRTQADAVRSFEPFFPRKTEQQIGIYLTSSRADNGSRLVESPEFVLQGRQIAFRHQINLIQEQQIRRIDLHPRGMAKGGESDQAIGVYKRNDPVQSHPWESLLNIEH